MFPLIAIVGKPNVGKSTLFNRLTKTRSALVSDQPYLTRDRQYGAGSFEGKTFLVIDTGGIVAKGNELDALVSAQAWQAVLDADLIFFVVDARGGLSGEDQVIIDRLRRVSKKVYLLVNKVDGLDRKIALADFYQIGFKNIFPISAEHNLGIEALVEEALAEYPSQAEQEEKAKAIKVAMVGRPNVGKSTLINRILGEKRVVVSETPGTTRDSIYVDLVRRGENYLLIDTAGVRKKGRIEEKIEKFSVVKTLKAIEDANVVVLLFDAREGITEQDLHLLGLVLDLGRALVLAVNKWDGLDQYQKDMVRKELRRRLPFVDFAKVHFISALHGTGVGNLFGSINKAYQSAFAHFSTKRLTEVLQEAVEQNTPPLFRGKPIKLKHAHFGGKNPPIIVVYGVRIEFLSRSYLKYLERFFRKKLKLVGTPLRIEAHE
jgi:GTPase